MAPQENCRTKAAWCRGAALVVLLTGALVGCNSGDGSRPAETPPPAVTESASSSPAPTAAPAVYKPADATGPAQNVPVPVLPEVAKTETKEGAEEFSKYWFSVLSYSYETGDLSTFEHLEPDECSACEAAKKVIANWHSQGRWLVGGRLSTPAATTTSMKDPEGTYKVAVQVHQEPLSYMRADGTVAHTDAQIPDQGNLLVLTYNQGAWTVVDLGSIVG